VSAPLISLIGAPASGKTTVARWLAESLPARLVLEDYAGNPFLADSYAGRTEWRLAGQTWFLLSRVRQLAIAAWPEDGLVVSDYAFAQDGLYAQLWLEGDELETYRRLAHRVEELVRPPSVLIHLSAPVDLLSERIARRGRDYERNFTEKFLQKLCRCCEGAVATTECGVLRVDVARHDLTRDDSKSWLLEQLAGMLAGG